MRVFLISSILSLLFTFQVFGQNYTLFSPNKNINLSVDIEKEITWSVKFKGNPAVKSAKIGMNFSKGKNFGSKDIVKDYSIESVESIIRPSIPHKDAIIKDQYTSLKIVFKSNYELYFRAYNEGISYQFIDLAKGNRDVESELASFSFPEGTSSFFPKEESMYSHNERTYLNQPLTDISTNDFCSLPVVFDTDKVKILFTETALHDYPGMFLEGTNSNTVNGIYPNYVLEAVPSKNSPDRNQDLVTKATYIAKTSGNRAYPWRVFIISDDDRTFVESNLTYQLSQPLALSNTNWIKPGKVAWDWYNANNIFGVDFKAGLNTETYKYYLDFASENKIEYVILDEGWTKSTTEILENNPDIDVAELIRYGKSKGVELILWVLWKPLDENLTEILELYKSWGVAGVKVDFMQRNDQYMVSSYERIAKECARLELLVDFHGSFKPSGLRRMYPNVINYEGVKGNENNKWSADIHPAHNVTVPFIRMAAGPMDYTPGSMENRQEKNYFISFERPQSLGTRAHQVAMYVVYEAPLQMICESPARLKRDQETVDYIVQIPTTWDETIVLHGSIGEYIAVARRSGEQWYLGAMTNWTERDLKLDLSFLPEGSFTMKIFKDGMNAHRFAEDYTIENIGVNKDSKTSMPMAPGGGWVAVISKK